MPFHELQWEWAENLFVSDDTKPEMGAPAIHGGKRGFGGMLFPTLHVLQMLQGLNLQILPKGFSVPAGTAMWVLLVYNAVDGQWQAADAAGPGHVKQRLHADNMVQPFFGHTLSGGYGRVKTFSQGSLAYVQSGGLHYFALMSLLQHMPVLVDRSILCAPAENINIYFAPAEDMSSNYALCEDSYFTHDNAEEMGGLDMFHNGQDDSVTVGLDSLESLEMESLEMEEDFVFSGRTLYDPRGLSTWEQETNYLEERDNDKLSQATTPVTYRNTSQPASCGGADDYYYEKLPECFDFGQPVTSEGETEMLAQIVEVDTDQIIGQQPQPPPEQPVPRCKRFLQLDVPPAEAPAPAPSAPLVRRALPAPPAKKMKLTSAPSAKAPKKRGAEKAKAPPVQKAAEKPALTEDEIIEQFVAQKHDSADYGPMARAHELLLEACEAYRVLQTINNGTYDSSNDSE